MSTLNFLEEEAKTYKSFDEVQDDNLLLRMTIDHKQDLLIQKQSVGGTSSNSNTNAATLKAKADETAHDSPSNNEFQEPAQFLQQSSVTINCQKDLGLFQCAAAFSNKYINVVGIKILSPKVQALYNNSKYIVRAYLKREQIFENTIGTAMINPLDEEPSFMDVCDTCIAYTSSQATKLMVVDVGGFYKDLSRTVGPEDFYRRLSPGDKFMPIPFDLPKKEDNIGKMSSQLKYSEFKGALGSLKESSIQGIHRSTVRLHKYSLQLLLERFRLVEQQRAEAPAPIIDAQLQTGFLHVYDQGGKRREERRYGQAPGKVRAGYQKE